MLPCAKERSKLQYFGHICRRQGDNIEKIIGQGRMEGSRRRARPKLRWTDGIKQLTGLSLVTAHRLAQDRTIWKTIINRVTKGQPWPIWQRRRYTVNDIWLASRYSSNNFYWSPLPLPLHPPLHLRSSLKSRSPICQFGWLKRNYPIEIKLNKLIN